MPHSNLCKFYINRLPLVYSTVWAIVRKNATAKLPFCSISNVRTLLKFFFWLRQLAPMMSYTCTALYTDSRDTVPLYCSCRFSWHCPFILQLRVLVTLSLYTAATSFRDTVPLLQLQVLVPLSIYTAATDSRDTVSLYCSYGFSCDTVPLYCSYGFS